METCTQESLFGPAGAPMEGCAGSRGAEGDRAQPDLPADRSGGRRAVGEGQPGSSRGLAMIRLVVRGTPAPQGSKSFKGLSKKTGQAILVESSKKVRPWRQDVKAAAEAWKSAAGAAPIDGPVVVRMTFTLPKPASAPKRRRTYPMRTPDLSKLARSTEDALTDAGIWQDDARVIEYTRLAKVFPMEGDDALDSPGAVIEIWEVTA